MNFLSKIAKAKITAAEISPNQKKFLDTLDEAYRKNNNLTETEAGQLAKLHKITWKDLFSIDENIRKNNKASPPYYFLLRRLRNKSKLKEF